jgi:natural product precursor
MKKVKLTNKLALNKETLTALDKRDLRSLKGGLDVPITSIGAVCHSRNHPTDCATAGGACHAD